ncbi:RNA polymerase sigma factor [Kitasatospora sp. A2-31]|uniref:RNA polymerase sigma factor n=1 Tax=Kitasatospora sp. A2-31 TaxID=2916414 RepID=UPI001EE9B283|nr:sigma-70 family RNA polymerase sigma factor [Kitasatospora sp. A2-31]MCG6497850.1 sigma-70 family RNA polymerase sigma factor [Kitasatospora sp. A2-31]
MRTTAPSELVGRCLAGEPDAWDELVGRYTPLVFAIVRSHRLSAADCEDVVRAAWLRVVRHLSELRPPERIVPWIAAAARRESLAHVERSGRRLPAGESEGTDRPEAAGGGVPSPLPDSEQDDEVLRAFRRLPECCQALLGLLVADPQMPDDEIGAALGIPPESVGPKRGRCLARLERTVREQAGEPGRTDGTVADVRRACDSCAPADGPALAMRG